MKKEINIIFICIAGLALRLYNLGRPSLWLDEFYTFSRVDCSLTYTLTDLLESPFPPLYYLMMNIWVKIFGISAIALRFPSAIFSTLAIFIIFKLAKELYDEEVGLLSAILLCVSPYSIYYAQEAKMYSMLWFLGAVSFLFLYRYVKSNKKKDLFIYVITTVLSIYTMYIGILFIIVSNITFLWLAKIKRIKIWLLGQLVIILLYIPWMHRFFYHSIYRPHMSWIPKTNNYLGYIINMFRTTTGTLLGRISFLDLFIYCLLGISAFITFTNIKRHRNIFDFRREDSLPLAWIIVPLLVFLAIDKFMFPILIMRYMGFIHIPLIILFSKGLNKYNFKVSFKFTVLLFLLFTIFSAHLYPYYKDGKKQTGQEWNKLFNRFYQIADDNTLILRVNVPDFVIRYFDRRHEIIEFKGDLGQQDLYNKYKSIFIVCIGNRNIEKIKSIVGQLSMYEVQEESFSNHIGFLWLKKKQLLE